MWQVDAPQHPGCPGPCCALALGVLYGAVWLLDQGRALRGRAKDLETARFTSFNCIKDLLTIRNCPNRWTWARRCGSASAGDRSERLMQQTCPRSNAQ
jgi:hypothetical protein